MATRLTVKGQVTVPKAIRDTLGVGPGDLLEFGVSRGGGVELRKANEGDRLRQAIATIRARRSPADGLSTDAYMATIRDDP